MKIDMKEKPHKHIFLLNEVINYPLSDQVGYPKTAAVTTVLYLCKCGRTFKVHCDPEIRREYLPSLICRQEPRAGEHK